MAFNKFLAYRSQGVNPSMYSDNRQEAMKLMDEDMYARWGKDQAGFRAAMIRQAQLEAQGKLGEAAPETPPRGGQPAQNNAQGHGPANGAAAFGRNAHGAAPAQWPGMHPASHFAAHNNMVAATNAAWAKEMDSRRDKAEAESQREHEANLAQMQQQEKRQQQEDQEQASRNMDQARQARNRSLLAAAGLGGHTVKSDGYGNIKKTPHIFGNSPFAASLLGD
jgi:hypothetical protein